MAKEKEHQTNSSIFEIDNLRSLIELMREHELTEVDLRESDQRIRLRRGGDPLVVQTASHAPALPMSSNIASANRSEPAPASPAVADGVLIRSPTIGTFYGSPKPGAPAFVKVGDMVTADTIVCLVEAMKMFNEIPAGVSGKIAEIFAKDSEPVDNNKPLFRVIPA
jgi:acetyl-CoA carboxylase biotin carboxyl carrier protein